jgi:hypothetical protein
MRIYKYLIILSLGIFLSSCGENLAELNVDPNNSPSARPQEVLTSGIGYYGIALDDNFNENNALMAQYWAGGPGVALLDHERYFFEPGDFNAEWGRTYQQSLSDLSFVIKNGNDTRSGVAQILSVNIYQTLVDLYGDIPYSEALKGAIEDGSILTPKYDDAKVIYSDLIVKLDDALVKIAKGGEIGNEDLIFKGDLSKWVKFANSLKLKILMRQALVDASVGAQVKELISKGDFINTATDMAAIPFSGGATNNWNPAYAASEAGIGLFYVASNSIINVMNGLNDPRRSVIFNPASKTGTIVGLDQGNINELESPSPNDFSEPSSVAYGPTNSVILMSHWEVMFLRAEAAMRFGTTDDEKAMFDNAVLAHFSYIGAPGGQSYITNDVNYDAGASVSVKSNVIGIQKWISMCGLQETEGWIEARRFDTPESRLFTGQGTGIFKTPTRTVLGANVFPSIRLYPQSELSFNPNSPKTRKITDRVFWDN